MTIAGLHGRARVIPGDPFATCDRCGMLYNHSDLEWQYEWQGTKLQNLYLLVCRRTCLDIPNQTLRTPILPPDPVPIKNPRPGFYASQEGPPPPPQSVQEILDE